MVTETVTERLLIVKRRAAVFSVRAQGTAAPLRKAQGMDVLEVKRTLRGGVHTFPCEAVEMTADRAVLLYTLPTAGQVADLTL
ncbi:MAG TPA: hypothetical protein VHM88_07260, partial [Candidatus Acidoferrales bacterium]|nr:hypothetical protein [Candidatus Acidoferrales bacterium]